MIDLMKYLVVDWEATLGREVLLLKAEDTFAWANGKKTETKVGITVTVLCTDCLYEKEKIKLDLMKLPFELPDDPMPVAFEGLTGKLYLDRQTRNLRCSLSASGIKLLEE